MSDAPADGAVKRGRPRGAVVKFTSLEAYTNSGIGHKDDRKDTTSLRGSQGLLVSSCMKGWRKTMEDAHFIIHDVEIPSLGRCDILGVFDGHIDDVTAKYCAERIPVVLMEEIQKCPGDIESCLRLTFIRVDKEHKEGATSTVIGGATALVVIVGVQKIVVANAGDSRAVLYRSGKGYTPLTNDHKPSCATETQRIQQANFTVENGRIKLGTANVSLSVSRAIGDYAFKSVEGIPWEEQPITCNPEIRILDRGADDEFLLLGCDGVWECAGGVPEEDKRENIAGEMLRPVASGPDTQIKSECERLLHAGLATSAPSPIGCDNMTLVGVFFKA